MPWYIDKILYSVLWERAVHSGESISRMLDFAIRHYMPRLLEEYLSSCIAGDARSERNSAYWRGRYEQRPKPRMEIFITYACSTEKNDETGLCYRQEYKILRKRELFNLPFHPAWQSQY